MFCSNCGRELRNDVRFCSFCGTEVLKNPAKITPPQGGYTSQGYNNRQTVTINVPDIRGMLGGNDGSSDRALYMLLLLGANLFVTLGIFYKTISIDIMSWEGRYSVFDFFKFLAKLDSWGADVYWQPGVTIFRILVILFAVMSAIFFVNVLIAINYRQMTSASDSSKSSVWMGLISMGIQFFAIFSAKVSLNNAYDEGDVINPSIWAWLVIIVGIVHLAFLVKKTDYQSTFNATEAGSKLAGIAAGYNSGGSIGNGWRCPSCGRINKSFDETCSCGGRKDGRGDHSNDVWG